MEIEQNKENSKPKDKFLYPLFLFSGLIVVIHFLTFWIYMGLGVTQSGTPTKTNCFNSMWWSFLTIISALYLMHDLWFRCKKATGPSQIIPMGGWLLRLFLSFFFFKGSFIAFVSHSSIVIEDAAAWSFFAFFCNAMIFTVYVLRRGPDLAKNNVIEEEEHQCNAKHIALWGCQLLCVIFLAIMYGFACYQAVNVSLDMTVEIVEPGKRYDGTHLYCQGDKSQSTGTIVVIPDEDTPSLTWLDLVNLVSSDNRICIYDRPGYGWSYTGELPRNPDRMAQELYVVLQSAKESLPYFLLPHGKGAHLVWAYARLYYKTLGGLLLMNAESPGWYPENCPKPTQPLNYDFQRVFDNFALTRLNSESSLPHVWTKQNDTFIHDVVAQRASSRMSNTVYYERISQTTCSENYDNYQYGFGDLPVSVFTSGFNINTTCLNQLTASSDQCSNFMSASKTNSPFSALEAYRQVQMSNNGRWYLCSDCSHDAYLDSPDELKIALLDLINTLTNLEAINLKSVPDLFSPRISAIPEPQLFNNLTVTLVCRTARVDSEWGCYDSLCNWCDDANACVLSGQRECNSLNMNLFPKQNCADYCRDQGACTQDACLNNFLPIAAASCPSGYTCLST